METQSRPDPKASLAPALLFTAIAAYCFISLRKVTGAELSAVGFFWLALYFFKHPVDFSQPLWPQLKRPYHSTSLWRMDLIGILGVTLVMAGVVWHWLAP